MVERMSATETPTIEPVPSSTPQPEKPSGGFWWGTGRRKTAVARVRIKPGKGNYLINGRTIEDFFTELQYQNDIVAPLKATDTFGKMDVYIKVHGGGITGQAGACQVGLARALTAYDPTLEKTLRDNGYLTIDSRQVERKKPGQPGARKRFQFSKR